MTTILHLSDTHFGPKHAFADRSLAEYLLEDLRQCNVRPDCIVVSGDICEGGHNSELNEAATFLEHLRQGLGSPDIGVLVVPGNHDINWASYKAAKDRHQAFLAYKSFVRDELHKPCLDGNDRSSWFTDTWSNGSVFVLGLNSCIVDSPRRSGVGYVDMDQLRMAKDQFRDVWQSHPVRVAVVHHHLLPVAYTSLNPEKVRTESLTLNAEEVMRWLTLNDFHVALHGHQHQPFFGASIRYAYDDPEPNGPADSLIQHLVVIGAGSAGAQRNELGPIAQRAYNVLRFDGNCLEVTARQIHDNTGERFKDFRKPFTIPLRAALSPKIREVLDLVGLHTAKFADKAKRLVAGVAITVDFPTLITLFPSVLAAARDVVISTSSASTAFWSAGFGATLLELSKQRPKGHLRRIFITEEEEPSLSSLMDKQREANVVPKAVTAQQHRDIARRHVMPILQGLAPLGLSDADVRRILDEPERFAVAVYGSGADRFLGFDFEVNDAETGEKRSTVGFIFEPRSELVDAASRLLETLWAEGRAQEDLVHPKPPRAIALFGAHKWRRSRVVREALAAGLRVLLVKAETDSEPIHPIMESMVNGVFTVRDTVPTQAELKTLGSRISAAHGKDWYVLALDDYSAQTATLLAEVEGRDYFPVRAEEMTRRKHMMRARWNLLCEENSDWPLHRVEYEFRDYEAGSVPRCESSAGFHDYRGQFVVKPDELSASIEIHRASNREEIDAKVRHVLKRFDDVWRPAGAKQGITVKSMLQIEAMIPRATLKDCASAEFSVEVITTEARHRVVGVTQKWITDDFVEIGHVFPAAAFPDALRETLERCISILLDELKVQYAISHWEFIITPEHRLALVESQLRPGGDRIMELVEKVTGQSVEGALLRCLAGRPPPTDLTFKSGGGFAAVCFLAPDRCIESFNGYRVAAGAEELCRELQVDVERLKSGPWDGPSDWTNRHVSVLCAGPTLEEARERCAEAARSVVLLTGSGEVRLKIL